jgi:hypothetical protein
MKRIFVVLAAIVFLTGCDQSLTVRTTPVTLTVAQPPSPEGIDPVPVQFRVVTRDTIEQYMREQSQLQGSDNPSFVALSVQDLENLVLNLGDLRRYIEQQQAVIVYYQSSVAQSR